MKGERDVVSNEEKNEDADEACEGVTLKQFVKKGILGIDGSHHIPVERLSRSNNSIGLSLQ
jgi:hypothetical protein